MAGQPRIDPETVEVLLETTWRTAAAEAGRTNAVDQKAAALATFTSLVASLTATLGLRFVETSRGGLTVLAFSVGLLALMLSVALALAALVPRQHLALGMSYVRQFPTWSQIRKTPTEVRGETIRVLVQGLARQRESNSRRERRVRQAYACLLVGVVLVSAQAATLAAGRILE